MSKLIFNLFMRGYMYIKFVIPQIVVTQKFFSFIIGAAIETELFKIVMHLLP